MFFRLSLEDDRHCHLRPFPRWIAGMREDQTPSGYTMQDLGSFSTSREAIAAIYRQAVSERREIVGIVRHSWWLIRPRRVIRIRISFARGLPRVRKRRISLEWSHRENVAYCATVESSLIRGLWRVMRTPFRFARPAITR
jgi:hypothetical protein